MRCLSYSPKCTYYDTFTFQGNTYLLNAVVKVKDTVNLGYYEHLDCYGIPSMIQLVQAFTNHLGTNRWTYAKWYRSGEISYYTTEIPPDDIIESIVEPASTDPIPEPKPEYYKDLEVKDVVFGWAIYIATILFSLIFNGFIVIWAFATLYFFWWRDKKLKKPTKVFHGFNVYDKIREFNN